MSSQPGWKQGQPATPKNNLSIYVANSVTRSNKLEIDLKGFLAFGMESYTNPKVGQESKLSADVKLEESLRYKFRKFVLDNESVYELNYTRISELKNESDELSLINNLRWDRSKKLNAGFNTEFESGLLSIYDDLDNDGKRELVSAFLSPATIRAGIGAGLNIGKLKVDLSVPDVKLVVIRNEALFNGREDQEILGLSSEEGYSVQTGFKLAASFRHNISNEMELKTKARVFAKDENFSYMELTLDQDLAFKINKFLKVEFQSRYSYDGINDPESRSRNVLKFGFYF